MMKFIHAATLLVGVLLSATALASPVGTWNLTSPSPMGDMQENLIVNEDGTGSVENMMGMAEFSDAKIDGNNFEFTIKVQTPMGEVELNYSGEADGDEVSGNLRGPQGGGSFTGYRAE